LIPAGDNLYDLGSNSNGWASAFFRRRNYIGQHLIAGAATAPTLTRGAGAGSTWSSSITGNELCGYLTFTTGSSPASNDTVFTMTFPNIFFGPAAQAAYPIANLIPCNVNAATLGANSQLYPDHDSKSTTTSVFKIHSQRARSQYRISVLLYGDGLLLMASGNYDDRYRDYNPLIRSAILAALAALVVEAEALGLLLTRWAIPHLKPRCRRCRSMKAALLRWRTGSTSSPAT
jgi:hypothetical protein